VLIAPTVAPSRPDGVEGNRIGIALPKTKGTIERRIRPHPRSWNHDEEFAAGRLSMMRIIARRMKAAAVVA
jgi:hypothetical protein